MPAPDFYTVSTSINQRLGQIEAAQTTANATLWVAGVAAIAACLSFLGVFLTVRVLRRNGFIQARASQQLKHADFRQAWIDKLRDEMANFLKLATDRMSKPSLEPQVIQSMALILLRIDRKDIHYDTLIDALDEVLDATATPPKGVKSYGAAAGDYLMVCQGILKREWETTKKQMHEEPPEWRKAGNQVTPDATSHPAPPATSTKIKMPRHLTNVGSSPAAAAQSVPVQSAPQSQPTP